ncbi:uncharacterized protein NECHADRAFT_79846 [Fusarium vanettenii 77-13-4]|uniref:Uncharacterized protein n=1 Tax=Fusarium vanettenii (strain ATCC MYA-4622 / CBS 123669 / FGSC 9596 / NRRL 45880 / 77-13-4) TaxID=660122 RepID=C7Z0C8_FUSV7|nr:uncharacterized protein NECHADRAFT_79846 [Fusarium vanettenii 77-13-4]EEU42358.1 predicted protein [Fusarium vanettenii 77-13-4]
MRFSRPFPWGGRSSGSSKRPKSRKRDKKHQRKGPFQGLGNGLRDVGSFLAQVLSNPDVQYLVPWALALFVGIQIHKWLDPHTPGDGFWGNLMAMGIAQPGAAWPAAILGIAHVVPAVLNWWTTESMNRTMSAIPQARFMSPISAEEAFVIPEYLTTLESSIPQSNVVNGNFRLPQAMEASFRRAMQEADLLKEIHDGLMTDVKLRFDGHYDQLSQLHIDIERAIIDIADRNETTSYFGGLFTKDWPYARARSHYTALLSINNDMIETSKLERGRLIELLEELDVFETQEERHGAICGLRSKTLKSIRRWTKETKDIRAEVKVICNSSKRSKVKLWMAEGALRRHLRSIDAVREGLLELHHDQAKTLEAALLGYCKSLLEAMRRLAEFGNGIIAYLPLVAWATSEVLKPPPVSADRQSSTPRFMPTCLPLPNGPYGACNTLTHYVKGASMHWLKHGWGLSFWVQIG